MSGPCEVKHAHPWNTVAVKAGVDVVIMKRSYWDNFRMPPDMNPQKRYPVMENAKIKKRKTMHNVQDFNIEDKDDIHLSKLRWKEVSRTEYSHQEILRGKNEAQESKLVEYEDRQTVRDKLETHKTVSFNSKSEKIEVKTVTEDILPGSVKRNSQVSALKRKTGSELYEDVSEKNGREQKVIVCSKQMEIRWQEYHRIISQPKHFRALEMEICKLNVPAIHPLWSSTIICLGMRWTER